MMKSSSVIKRCQEIRVMKSEPDTKTHLFSLSPTKIENLMFLFTKRNEKESSSHEMHFRCDFMNKLGWLLCENFVEIAIKFAKQVR